MHWSLFARMKVSKAKMFWKTLMSCSEVNSFYLFAVSEWDKKLGHKKKQVEENVKTVYTMRDKANKNKKQCSPWHYFKNWTVHRFKNTIRQFSSFKVEASYSVIFE